MIEINISQGTKKKEASHAVDAEQLFSNNVPEELPVLPVKNAVLFPYTVLSLHVSQARSLALLRQLTGEKQLLAVVAYKNNQQEQPDPQHVYQTGCIGQIIRSKKNKNDDSIELLLQGLDKIKIDAWTSEEPFLEAKISTLTDIEPDYSDIEAKAIRNNLIQSFQKLVSVISYLPEQIVESVTQTREYRKFTYLISSSVRIDVKDAQEILVQEDVVAKMLKLTDLVNHELEVFELGKKIQSEARLEMEKSQRDYVLRQQLKAIRKELGEAMDSQVLIEEYRLKIDNSGMSADARKQADVELRRLERIPEASSEYNIVLTYLDWLTELPWQVSTKDNFDIEHARRVLDEDHFGLEKIKQRILEYLAVRKLKHLRRNQNLQAEEQELTQVRLQRESLILCLVGPPGIGKTSLGRSIARALGRKLYRISLGGVRDEAEIRGHRKTYLGAMPGRFITAMREVGTNNPVILLDEIDKLGSDWRGDPSSAMLEVLDPEQNRDFKDHFLEVAFDLSQTLFIATANIADNIPGPLMDRMETLTLAGYTDDEKLHIAKKYLLVRQKLENSLLADELNITDETILAIIRGYTREAGVRSLDRRLGTICRKAAIKVAEKHESQINITNDDLFELLGKPIFRYDKAEHNHLAGIAIGLAVTAVGGDILYIEATRMPGKKTLTITGQLGDVMRESAQTALSYVRSRANDLKIDPQFFEQSDIHIHIPQGAIPKDGPSAGVTLVVSLVSLLTGQPVPRNIGMTGEITLRGMVLSVGGVKDKVLAAHRADLTTIILPQHNENDLEDLPTTVRNAMTFILVDHIDKVLNTVFDFTPH